MITLDTLELPDELRWDDEYAWSDLRSAIRYTLQGKMITENSVVLASKGRPITLGSDDAWIVKADLETLRIWSQIVNHQMSLTLNDGRIFIVAFRLWDAPAIVTESLVPTAHPDDDTLYKINELKLAVV